MAGAHGRNQQGIPLAWVSTTTPVVPLAQGEQKEVALSIAPPRSAESRAGRHEFTLRVTSQKAPDQPVEIKCVLSVAAFADFKCTLSPVQINSGEVATLLVENEGNANQTFAKAGRTRWMGKRPLTRGVAKNPVDHPHGGGEGRTSGGRHPVTPWGFPTKGKKTRKNKRTNKFIIANRHARKKKA